MKIQCSKCKVELGEIREWTLRKGIVYMFARRGESESTADNYKNNQMLDFVQAIFKGNK